MFKRLLSLLLMNSVILSFCGSVAGQPPRGPLVISPDIHADKSVTFRYLAPAAKEVKLSAQFEKAPVPMVKDSSGIWRVRVGPVSPDIYPYSFLVDGITVMDPANVSFFPNERFKASLVDIPGDTALIHSLRDVPHGAVTYEYYPSLAGTTGTLVIYTPPGYDKQTAVHFPVYYLISGTTDTEETWFKVGRANFILDNLIAAGKAKPMIVVMPYGNIEARMAEQKGGIKPADPSNREGADAIVRAKNFENDLMKQVIPYVESNYRTIPGRNNRAIGGFSRGGGQTLRTAFGNLDQFAWVCSYASYLSTPEMERSFPSIYETPDNTNRMLKLFWISVGTDDFLYKPTIGFMDFLRSKNVRFNSLITDGGHTWMNTRKYLIATAQLLFQ
ncbi:esterase [Paraflavitalea sp. CAU 1676]|uniref:esterase n=1 Tax=Paraflavitalea sp. CAU 1676 TaxID=3032598 RepID=UPI0023D9DF7F|nr:esterase [Paraflavitalea sp. CAU 1676]MDF2191267.1 alpha/beta hydrolase-fold protein [Paraflavitalea sp. CAU 1676]